MKQILLLSLAFFFFKPLNFAGTPGWTSAPDTLLPPTCTAAPDIQVSCEAFDPTLNAYPGIIDQSPTVISVSTSVNNSQFDPVCNRGLIIRTFVVLDSLGQSGSCSQKITVDYRQDYFIRFPNDVVQTVCTPGSDYGEPVFFGEDCELLATSYSDQLIYVVPDACYKILRDWTVINWCTYDPLKSLINVPNPTPNAIVNHSSNLPGPVVSSIQTPGNPWSATVVKVSPSDTAQTNYSIFYDQNANGYKYTQSIKIADTQNPVLLNAPANDWFVSDTSANDDALWNAVYWWDNANQSHDLCETGAELSITATDACSGSNLNISFLLFLDLDGDGVMETMVNSTQLGGQPGGLGWNNVLFGNVSGTGQPREFDFRAVPVTQKWGFAMEQKVDGANRTASVKFNTSGDPTTYVNPQLPHGVHKIRWFIDDACGNSIAKEYLIIVRDTKAPEIYCLNGLSVNIMPTGMITLWATDFLQYTEDNCTLGTNLKLGIRRTGTGFGFPVDANGNPISSVTFNCNDLGTQAVELWSIDLAGNPAWCETFLIVQDNNDNCDSTGGFFTAQITTEDPDCGIEEVTVLLEATGGPFVPPFSLILSTNGNGQYYIPDNIPYPQTAVIRPEKDDNPLNGVTTYDLILIVKHILGLEPLSSPYKIIAADVNKSGTVTSFDIVRIRQLILGYINEFPTGSWRFVRKEYVFPNPLNPFSPPFPETAPVAEVLMTGSGDFIGVKMGDVNGTATCNGFAEPDDRGLAPLPFDVSRADGRARVEAGETVDLHFVASEEMLGCQFTLNFNGLEVLEIVPGNSMEADQFALFPDRQALTLAWETGGMADFTLKCRALKTGEISDMVSAGSQITLAEAYQENNGVVIRGIGLRFAGPDEFALFQNEPNPFENNTRISFNLPEAGEATLKVFDTEGRTLFSRSAWFEKGINAIDMDKNALEARGVLYYQLESAGHNAVKKMVKL